MDFFRPNHPRAKTIWEEQWDGSINQRLEAVFVNAVVRLRVQAANIDILSICARHHHRERFQPAAHEHTGPRRNIPVLLPLGEGLTRDTAAPAADLPECQLARRRPAPMQHVLSSFGPSDKCVVPLRELSAPERGGRRYRVHAPANARGQGARAKTLRESHASVRRAPGALCLTHFLNHRTFRGFLWGEVGRQVKVECAYSNYES
jgi:hypothetical protein